MPIHVNDKQKRKRIQKGKNALKGLNPANCPLVEYFCLYVFGGLSKYNFKISSAPASRRDTCVTWAAAALPASNGWFLLASPEQSSQNSALISFCSLQQLEAVVQAVGLVQRREHVRGARVGRRVKTTVVGGYKAVAIVTEHGVWQKRIDTWCRGPQLAATAGRVIPSTACCCPIEKQSVKRS